MNNRPKRTASLEADRKIFGYVELMECETPNISDFLSETTMNFIENDLAEQNVPNLQTDMMNEIVINQEIDEIIDSILSDNSNEEATNNVIVESRKKFGRPLQFDFPISSKLNANNKQSNQEYISRSIRGNIVIKPREMRAGCNSVACPRKCHSKIDTQTRQEIFEGFWKLANINSQRQFLIGCVKKQKKSNSDEIENAYFLQKDIQVCKQFLVDTLSISKQMIKTALSKCIGDTEIVSLDLRGKHGMQKSLEYSQTEECVKRHINSIPRVASHYCRQTSTVEYLPSELNVRKCFDLFMEKHPERRISLSTYRNIFSNLNLGFHQPKKDRCDFCECFNNLNNEERNNRENEMRQHINNKEIVRLSKERSKILSINQPTKYCSIVFDMQKTFQLPKADQSQFYYSRKLNAYNFTIYDLSNGDGFCYLWTENIAKKGANEVLSCLFNFLQLKRQQGCDTLNMYSDATCSQNRNWAMAIFLLFCVQKMGFLTATIHFFESGHSQNEGDSIHSTIERSTRKRTIFNLEELNALIRSARRSNPYKVFMLTKNGNFFDFDRLKADVLCESLKSSVRITSSKKIYCSATESNKISFSFNHERTLKTQLLISKQFGELSGISDPPKIDEDKRNDLKKLCAKNLIQSCYHDFYLNL